MWLGILDKKKIKKFVEKIGRLENDGGILPLSPISMRALRPAFLKWFHLPFLSLNFVRFAGGSLDIMQHCSTTLMFNCLKPRRSLDYKIVL